MAEKAPADTKKDLVRRLTAEAVGTALLLATVVGSGIMGERLAGGNVAMALLANTVATGAALVTLILTFGPISGAHFNPAVTLADASQGGLAWQEVPAYIIAQIVGAYVGVGLANMMFELPVFFASQHARHGASQLLSGKRSRGTIRTMFGALLTMFPRALDTSLAPNLPRDHCHPCGMQST
jgi:glycerol uptake facilitator-like aquaporin